MINDATKFSLGLAGFGLAAAVVYALGNGDDAGALLLLALAIAAGIVGFGVSRTLGADPAPFARPDTEPAAVTLGPDDVPGPSVFPLLAAVGIVLGVAGGAFGSQLAVEGLVVAAAGFGGWLAGSWLVTATFSERDAANLDDRLVGPVALPVVAFIITAIVAVSFSRVLLAVSATASWVIALIVAAVVLAVLWTLASRGASRRVGFGLAALGLAATLAAGGAGASVGPREFHPHEEDESAAVELVAKDVKFEEDTLELPAESDAEIVFVNLDIGTNHNVSVYTAEEPGTPVFAGPPILRGQITYTLRTPAPGVYRYVCDFHPNMIGNLNVVVSANEPHEEEHGEDGH